MCMPRVARLAVPAGLALLAFSALAQAPVSGVTLSGKAAAHGAPMTRDELRLCLKEQRVQKDRAAELGRRQAALDAEAAAARQQKDDVQQERDAYQRKVVEMQGLDERFKAHGERLGQYNQRVKEFRENPPKGADAERLRGQIEAEGDALAQADAAIKAEAAKLSAELTESRQALVAHAQAQSAAASAVNEGRRLANDEVKAHDADVDAWNQRCGNRPYLVADERAIRAGK
jgi:transketolase